jgi:O-antigen polysaccharide polymerase Wzy
MSLTQSQLTLDRSRSDWIWRLGRIFVSPLWGWCAVGAMVIAYIYATPEHRFPGAIACAVTFALVESFLPACQPIASTVICPWNWAIFLFFLQLVMLPFSILVMGPSLGVLPRLPSNVAINEAMFLNALAFLVFAITYQHCSRKSNPLRVSERLSPKRTELDTYLSSRFIQINFALGIAGLFLAFGGVGNFLGYFLDPGDYAERLVQASHTLRGVSSLLLRPFLGVGLVMLWCRWIDRNSQSKSPRWTSFVTLGAVSGVMLSYATFSYNRGAFVVPLIAMLAVLIKSGKKASLGAIALAGTILIIVLLLAPFYAVYRNSDLTGGLTASDLMSDSALSGSLADTINPLEMIQMYGSGPQYLGFLVETSHWGTKPYFGRTLLPSLVEPLPVLGRTFRNSSGPVIYNEMIYGTTDIFDQIIPFSGEMFLNFGFLGVIAGFCFLGIVAHRLQRGFESAPSLFEAYIWQYAAIWVLFLTIGSISVVSQVCFYFAWPIYLYFFRKWHTQRQFLVRNP